LGKLKRWTECRPPLEGRLPRPKVANYGVQAFRGQQAYAFALKI
jgi:hypothetical protein